MSIFKPRIFISSTLDLASARKQIKEIFDSIGAETLEYEINLTPSSAKMSYRQDIIDSDFVIFIFSEKYGQKTKNGISGTHEEWNIVKNRQIPCHVYRKKTEDKDEELINFEKKEIEHNEVSYYYFEDEKDLIDRIKLTSFQIAHEIALSKLDKADVDVNVIRRLAIHKDSETLLKILRPIEEILTTSSNKIQKTTNILSLVIEENLYPNIENYGLFIDTELNKIFSDFIKKWYIFSNKQKELYFPDHDTFYPLNSRKDITHIIQMYIFPEKALEADSLDKPYNELKKVYRRLKKRFIKLNENSVLYYF